MRQIGDLAIWVGMIVIAMGVVYYTPIVAEYVTSEPNPQVVAQAPRGPGAGHAMFRPPHDFGGRRAVR